MHIFLKAKFVEDLGNGVLVIEVEDAPSLTNEQARVFEELFPNLGERAAELLTKEQLLRIIARSHEIQREPGLTGQCIRNGTDWPPPGKSKKGKPKGSGPEDNYGL